MLWLIKMPNLCWTLLKGDITWKEQRQRKAGFRSTSGVWLNLKPCLLISFLWWWWECFPIFPSTSVFTCFKWICIYIRKANEIIGGACFWMKPEPLKNVFAHPGPDKHPCAYAQSRNFCGCIISQPNISGSLKAVRPLSKLWVSWKYLTLILPWQYHQPLQSLANLSIIKAVQDAKRLCENTDSK